MLEPSKVLFFAQSAVSVRPSEDPRDIEGVVFAKHGFRSYPHEVVTGRPSEAAADARAAIELDDGPFLVHFDVDVLDFLDCPLADQPEDQGLLLNEAIDASASSRAALGSVGWWSPRSTPTTGTRRARRRRFAAGLAHALAG